MSTSRRNRGVGAGYDYQWDVALHFLLRFVVHDRAAVQGEVNRLLEWLGPIASITLEGSAANEELEDLTLWSNSGRELQIQIKESDEDATKKPWRASTGKFVAFMARVARRIHRPDRRVLFLTNGTFHEDITKLLSDRNKLAALHAKCFGEPRDEPAPIVEASIANWEQVSVSEFFDATPIDSEIASQGVGLRNIQLLDELQVPDPPAAYQVLWREVARRSYLDGGTTLTSLQLRDELRRLLGLSLRSPGSRLTTLIDRLQQVSHDLPSWATFESGRVWIDEARASAVEGALRVHRLALIVGGAGSGKTVLSRIVGIRLDREGWCPVYWDFQHQGRFPHPVGDVWKHAAATARIARRKPMLLLENVHLAADEFVGVMGQLELDAGAEAPMIVLATARTTPNLPRSLQLSLNETVIDLATGAEARGHAVLQWWLQDVLQLDEAIRLRAYQSVPWSRYLHDLVVLSLALDAFDPAAAAVTTERIEVALEQRLEGSIASLPGADELLYLVAALGSYALAADLRALGAMLNQTPEGTRAIVERAVADGLISVDAERRTCRFWHDSLAQAYWDVFQLRRLDWARELRARYRSMP